MVYRTKGFCKHWKKRDDTEDRNASFYDQNAIVKFELINESNGPKMSLELSMIPSFRFLIK